MFTVFHAILYWLSHDSNLLNVCKVQCHIVLTFTRTTINEMLTRFNAVIYLPSHRFIQCWLVLYSSMESHHFCYVFESHHYIVPFWYFWIKVTRHLLHLCFFNDIMWFSFHWILIIPSQFIVIGYILMRLFLCG